MAENHKFAGQIPKYGQTGIIEDTPIQDIPSMYAAAEQAFRDWGSKTVKERLVFFRRLRLVIVEELEQTTGIISTDTGKVPMDALVSDIMPVLDFLKSLEKEAEGVLGPQKAKTPIVLIGKKSSVEYIPRGRVLIISPWNYPFQLTMIPIISALIGGNCVISKPSEVTPQVGLFMEKLFEKAGFPEGVIQFVFGGKEAGEALVSSKPDYIFFTGSVATGRIIAQQAAKNLIPITLELGGKDPMIVCEDANLERAAKGAVWGAFTNSGQVCMSVERLYVHERVYEQFVGLVKKEVEMLTQGTSTEDDVGSMTFSKQLDIVKAHVDDALEKGANLISGTAPNEWKQDTMFLEPMVLTNVTSDMEIVTEETFGPILPIMPFSDESEAIRMANSTQYGLNASVWSQDLPKAKKIASRLVSGAVTINDVIITVANHHLPFGGAKNSGIGRYHGKEGLRIFCHEKAVMIDRGSKTSEIQWYPYKGKYDDFKEMIESFYGPKTNWAGFVKRYLKLLKKGD